MSVARDYGFDLSKAVLITLVVFGHFLQQCINNCEEVEPLISALYYFVYSFHMPAFMFITGWFSYNRKLTTNKFLKDLCYLVVPIIIWDVVIYIIDYFFSGTKEFSALFISLWYIKSLIFIKIVSLPFLIKPNIITLCFLILCGIVLGQYYLLSLLIPSFICGYYFRKFNLFKPLIIKGGVIVFLLELLLVHPYIEVSGLALIKNLQLDFWINYINRLILGITGAIIFINVMRFFAQKNIQFIYKLGRETLGIYMIQCIIAERVLCTLSSNINNVFVYFMFAILTTYICYYLVIAIRKYKYSNYIIGK